MNKRFAAVAAALLVALAGPLEPAAAHPSTGKDSQAILSIDHYVPNQSIVPAIRGQAPLAMNPRASERPTAAGPGARPYELS